MSLYDQIAADNLLLNQQQQAQGQPQYQPVPQTISESYSQGWNQETASLATSEPTHYSLATDAYHPPSHLQETYGLPYSPFGLTAMDHTYLSSRRYETHLGQYYDATSPGGTWMSNAYPQSTTPVQDVATSQPLLEADGLFDENAKFASTTEPTEPTTNATSSFDHSDHSSGSATSSTSSTWSTPAVTYTNFQDEGWFLTHSPSESYYALRAPYNTATTTPVINGKRNRQPLTDGGTPSATQSTTPPASGGTVASISGGLFSSDNCVSGYSLIAQSTSPPNDGIVSVELDRIFLPDEHTALFPPTPQLTAPPCNDLSDIFPTGNDYINLAESPLGIVDQNYPRFADENHWESQAEFDAFTDTQNASQPEPTAAEAEAGPSSSDGFSHDATGYASLVSSTSGNGLGSANTTHSQERQRHWQSTTCPPVMPLERSHSALESDDDSPPDAAGSSQRNKVKAHKHKKRQMLPHSNPSASTKTAKRHNPQAPAGTRMNCPSASCPKRFRNITVNDLMKHVKEEHKCRRGTHRFFCPFRHDPNICPKGFSTYKLPDLLRHILTHGGGKTYPCEFPGCSNEYARSDAMRRHMKADHLGESSTVSAATSSKSRKAGTKKSPDCTDYYDPHSNYRDRGGPRDRKSRGPHNIPLAPEF